MGSTKITMPSETFFLYALTLEFIFLKLTGNIAWSWIWVLSPIWIPIVLIIVFTLTVFMITDLSK